MAEAVETEFTKMVFHLAVKAPIAAELVQFYKEAFGAEEVNRTTSMGRDLGLTVELRISSLYFMVSDYLPEVKLDLDPPARAENRKREAKEKRRLEHDKRLFVFRHAQPIHIRLETENVVDAVAKAVSVGAKRFMGNDGGCFVEDPLGITWIICTPVANRFTAQGTSTSAPDSTFLSAKLQMFTHMAEVDIAINYYKAAFGAIELGRTMSLTRPNLIYLAELQFGSHSIIVSDIWARDLDRYDPTFEKLVSEAAEKFPEKQIVSVDPDSKEAIVEQMRRKVETMIRLETRNDTDAVAKAVEAGGVRVRRNVFGDGARKVQDPCFGGAVWALCPSSVKM